jgi:hypothetical protein
MPPRGTQGRPPAAGRHDCHHDRNRAHRRAPAYGDQCPVAALAVAGQHQRAAADIVACAVRPCKSDVPERAPPGPVNRAAGASALSSINRPPDVQTRSGRRHESRRQCGRARGTPSRSTTSTLAAASAESADISPAAPAPITATGISVPGLGLKNGCDHVGFPTRETITLPSRSTPGRNRRPWWHRGARE